MSIDEILSLPAEDKITVLLKRSGTASKKETLLFLKNKFTKLKAE